MKIESLNLPHAQARRVTWIVLAGALWYVSIRIVLLGVAAVFEPAATVDLILDDAYYYLGIAYNLGKHGQSSFDGLTKTNGYQPAWLLLLAAVEGALQLEKKALFVALQALILLATGLPLVFCLRRRSDPFYLALAGGLVGGYACYPGVFLFGLETALFAPAIVALAHVARRGLEAGAPRAAWLFALAVWIRLDALGLAAAYAAFLASGVARRDGVLAAGRAAARVLLPSLLSLGVYMAANWLFYGTPVPVSGLAKSIGAPAFSNWGIGYYYLLQSVPLLVGGAFVLLAEALWGKFEGVRATYTLLAVVAASLVPHYLYYAAFSGWIPWPWYFYAFALMTVLLGARVVSIALSPRSAARAARWTLTSLLLLGALGVPALIHGTMIWQFAENQRRGGTPGGSVNRRNMADAADFASSGERATIAMGDRMGGLGYWAPPGVHVFALEGLVASRAYLEARRRDDAERWLRQVIRPDYLIVDRESVPLVRADGSERYIVIEPIQGRVVFDHLLTFCFPPSALVKQTRERDDQVTVLSAPALRLMFDMRRAEPCAGGHERAARAWIMAPDSPRRSAVQAEYAWHLGGGLTGVFERFDRGLALRRRAAQAVR